MKRVLHVMGRLECSGMETMLLSSYVEWLRHGYECDVVATSKLIGSIAPRMRDRGYGVFHIPFRGNWRYFPRLRFVREFYLLCKSGYQVVHIHAEAGRPVFALLAKLAGVKQIAVTPHGSFKFHGALRIRKLCERHLVRLLGGRFGMISEGVSACEWERFRIKGLRISNWFDTSQFRPPSPEERAGARRNLGIGAEDFVIVSVGNCSSIKNHAALLRAIAMLPSTLSPLYLHIGREEHDLPERKLAAELNIEGNVRFLEAQPDPLPFLWAADVFAMPSRSEGLGIAALEAIAASTPVVLPDGAGLSDIAALTRWTIVTSTTPESVAAGIERVALMEPAERRNKAFEDSQIVRERFSLHNGVRSVVQALYT